MPNHKKTPLDEQKKRSNDQSKKLIGRAEEFLSHARELSLNFVKEDERLKQIEDKAINEVRETNFLGALLTSVYGLFFQAPVSVKQVRYHDKKISSSNSNERHSRNLDCDF